MTVFILSKGGFHGLGIPDMGGCGYVLLEYFPHIFLESKKRGGVL